MAKHAAQSVAQHVAEQVAEMVAHHVSGQPFAQDVVPRHAGRLVVYTAVLDDKQPLREVPLAAESTADFICLTTDPTLRSDTWQVIGVEPRLPTDLVRSERFLKIVGHPALAGYDRSLWVDNAVELTELPETFVDGWLSGADVAAPVHTYYRTLLEEAEASIERGHDDHLRIFEQLAHYLRAWPETVEANPHWTALLARRRTPEVDAAMTTWWEHVLRFSRRDQIAFGVAMAQSGVRLKSLPLPNLRSTLHRWSDGWVTRAEEEAATGSPEVGVERPGRIAPGPVTPADPAELRAEIDSVLDQDSDPHAWVWELEARMAAATENVRRLRDQIQRHRSS
jgi:Protein of unknown function (DUF616)